MEIIVTDEDTGRKYKLVPDSSGLCFQLWRTTLLKKGEKAKNGKAVKNEWQFTSKYPRSLDHGLYLIYDLMMKDPERPGTLTWDCEACDKLHDYVKKELKKMAKSIEVTNDNA